ncbi:hypothetical protein BJY52DRAFT_1383499 [Lactarius psammicola]|nr:hypothetical protein BJY52DRAFT_1383499 [Lactarius psammicola]
MLTTSLTPPPRYSAPIKPLGAVQTNSLLSPPIASQGTPTPYSTSAPSLEISADAPVSVSAPHGPGPAPGTQFAAGPIVPAPTPVSSYGGLAPVPLRGTARVTHSYPALPEAPNPPLRPILMPAQWTGWALNSATPIPVLISTLTTALGAALRGKNVRTHIPFSALSPISDVIESRKRHHPRRCINARRALIVMHAWFEQAPGIASSEAFQLDHGHEVGRQWDEKIDSFRLRLENMLDNQPGSVTTNSEAAGTDSGSAGKGVGATNPVSRFNGTGKYPTSVTNGKLGLKTK